MLFHRDVLPYYVCSVWEYFRSCAIQGAIYLCCTLGVVDQGVVIASVISKSGYGNAFSSLRTLIAAVMGQVLFRQQPKAAIYHASSVLLTMVETLMLLDRECFHRYSRVLFYFYVRSVCFLLDYVLFLYFRVLHKQEKQNVDDGIVAGALSHFFLLLRSGRDGLLLSGPLFNTKYL